MKGIDFLDKEQRAKTYSSLKDNNYEDKKGKGTKKCVMQNPLNFKIIKTV